jgi:hypothetical protein
MDRPRPYLKKLDYPEKTYQDEHQHIIHAISCDKKVSLHCLKAKCNRTFYGPDLLIFAPGKVF